MALIIEDDGVEDVIVRPTGLIQKLAEKDGANTIAALEAALKKQYLPSLKEMMNEGSTLMKLLSREERPQFAGKGFTIPVHIGPRNTAAYWMEDDRALPTAGTQHYQQVTFTEEELEALRERMLKGKL